MRENPVHAFDQRVRDSKRSRSFLNDLSRKIYEDDNSRSEWLAATRQNYRERYRMEWRKVDFPWPGAANIVPPLIDMMCDRAKPGYTNLVTAVHPPVTVLAVDQKSQARAPDVEVWFDWLIRVGSPGFVPECILAIDDGIEMGRMILKSLWLYESRTEPETFQLERLHPDLLVGVVMTKQNAMFLGDNGGSPLSTAEFDRHKEQIKARVVKYHDFDPDEKIDKRALDDVLDWMRAGANEPLTVKRRDRIVDAPGIVAVPMTELIVPPDATGIETASQITHRMYMTEQQMRARARDANWDDGAVTEFLAKRVKEQQNDRGRPFVWENTLEDEARREGVRVLKNEQIVLYETCTWMDVDLDGVDEKVVILWSPDAPEMPFKFYQYARPSGRWPYHQAPFELNKRRWYSPRGIPAKLLDLQKEIMIQHRAKLNRMLISNTINLVGRQGSILSGLNARWVPGQILWTQNPQTDLMPLQLPNLDISFDREEAILRTWAEQYIGSPDYGNLNTTGGLTEARTATEIRGIQSQSSEALSLRGTLFQLMMAEVYREMFDLWMRHGPQKQWINITDSEPLELTKEDLRGAYVFQCTGKIGEQDPMMKAQKSLARIQILMQLQAQGAIGKEWKLDMGEAVRDWLETDDLRAAHRIMRRATPQEIQQADQQEQQMQSLQGALAGMQAAQGGMQGGGTKPAKNGKPSMLGITAGSSP